MSTHANALNDAPGVDDSGAVLVIGVFMCACMVGFLWYMAGLGDAIIFRERLQEASDAVALSSAILQARGMNLIVLLNLIMACILAVRVALKAIQLALLIVAAIVWPASAVCLEAADVVQDIIDLTRAPINNTIKVLSKTQTGIKWVAPPAALVGARNVGQKFRPIVQEADAANLATITGLPVEEDSAGHLCREAGMAVVEIIESVPLIPKPPQVVAGRINRLISKAVEMGGLYFCELGDTGVELERLTRTFEGGCDEELAELTQQRDEAENTYTTACSRYGLSCTGTSDDGRDLPPAQSSHLSNLRASRHQAKEAVSRFNRRKCEKQKQEKLDEVMNERSKRHNSLSPPGSSSGMTSKRVRTSWVNGGSDAQLLAVSKGDLELLALASRRVKIAAWRRNTEVTTPKMGGIAFSQAELFFDCSGSWQSEKCNGHDDEFAMWHLRWRARLRRFDALAHGDLLERLSGVVMGADAFQRIFQEHRLPSPTLHNTGILYDLVRSSADPIVH